MDIGVHAAGVTHSLAHDPWLVALSILVAMQGAYVGLALAGRVAAAEGVRRRVLLVGAAATLAVGIWSMHFIGLLAARLPVGVDYLVAPTVFSLLVCVMVVGAGMLLAATDLPLVLRVGAGGLGMGAGIASMHYIGMGALAGAMTMSHAPGPVVLSLVLAVAASTAALWLCFEAPRQTLWASAIAMGLAVSGMHYTAMAGMTLHAAPAEAPSQFASSLSPDGLALTVALVAFAVSGAFLATLTPERARPGRARRGATEIADANTAQAEPAAETLAAPVARTPAVEPPEPPSVRDGASRTAPLGGVGGPPRRPARTLTVERNGTPLALPVGAVRCVRANAHYTYVRDGEHEYFCGLSIGEAEAALDPARFLRIHRSHVVNLDHVVAVRRAGDNGVALLDDGRSLPVARARLATLKRRFETEEQARTRPLDAAE
ncbi:MHYT domain-containing protein [Salinarimonas rosea]|uniref:MHYT domain-containing protein n=1 Tax=Salinarimonas rosea TaxID=552063 RepID=UPI0003FD734E|nr:MHYT domain-containing protein [Salinarimonas rosea]